MYKILAVTTFFLGGIPFFVSQSLAQVERTPTQKWEALNQIAATLYPGLQIEFVKTQNGFSDQDIDEEVEFEGLATFLNVTMATLVREIESEIARDKSEKPMSSYVSKVIVLPARFMDDHRFDRETKILVCRLAKNFPLSPKATFAGIFLELETSDIAYEIVREVGN